MPETDDPATKAGESSTFSHRMRITTGGSIQAYIRFALQHLNDNPHRPLVLHTLPPQSCRSPSTLRSASSGRTTLHSCTLAVPRLVSVVEQIKRQYVAHSSHGGKDGKCDKGSISRSRPTRGIWQYTESGLMPLGDDHAAEGEEAEDPLVRVLQGKTKPKMTHHPYLQITLSTTPIGLEEGESGRSVTCQYVLAAKRKRRDGDAAGKKGKGVGEEKDQRDISLDGSTMPRPESVSAKAGDASLGGRDGRDGKDGKDGLAQKALKRKSETDGERRGKKPKKGMAGVKKI